MGTLQKVFLINISPKRKSDIPNKYYNYFSYAEILFAIAMFISYFLIKKNIPNTDILINPNKEDVNKMIEHRKLFFNLTLIPYYIELIIIILSFMNIIKIYPNDTN